MPVTFSSFTALPQVTLLAAAAQTPAEKEEARTLRRGGMGFIVLGTGVSIFSSHQLGKAQSLEREMERILDAPLGEEFAKKYACGTMREAFATFNPRVLEVLPVLKFASIRGFQLMTGIGLIITAMGAGLLLLSSNSKY